ncbi:hypothetical protein ACFX13_037000 [Malus domestica]
MKWPNGEYPKDVPRTTYLPFAGNHVIIGVDCIRRLPFDVDSKRKNERDSKSSDAGVWGDLVEGGYGVAGVHGYGLAMVDQPWQ